VLEWDVNVFGILTLTIVQAKSFKMIVCFA
jgi:hypothetical protein